MPATLPEIEYQIYSGEQSTKTDPFTLVINPETHNLCGPLQYTAYYDNQPEPEDGIADPFGYTPGSMPIVTVQTDDPSLADMEKPWKVVAEFRDWPTDGAPIDDPAQSAEATSIVRYIDGCNNPTSFTASSQPPAAEFTFSGGATTNKINDFSVVPVNCEIEYACKQVVGPDGPIACDDPSNPVNFCTEEDVGCTDGPKVTIDCTKEQYLSGQCKPGTYCTKFTGTVVQSTA